LIVLARLLQRFPLSARAKARKPRALPHLFWEITQSLFWLPIAFRMTLKSRSLLGPRRRRPRRQPALAAAANRHRRAGSPPFFFELFHLHSQSSISGIVSPAELLHNFYRYLPFISLSSGSPRPKAFGKLKPMPSARTIFRFFLFLSHGLYELQRVS